MKYFRPVGDEISANFEKVNNLVEFLQCYALSVRKDKNQSKVMEDILHPKDS